MKEIYAFDLDDTPTTKDAPSESIRFIKGSGQMFRGFLFFSPPLILMKLYSFSNWKTKQEISSYFSKGMNINDLGAFCVRFAEQNKHLLRLAGTEKVRQAIEEEQATVPVISASIDSWIQFFFDEIDREI